MQDCHLSTCIGVDWVHVREEEHCSLLCEGGRLEKEANMSVTELRRQSMTEELIREIREELASEALHDDESEKED